MFVSLSNQYIRRVIHHRSFRSSVRWCNMRIEHDDHNIISWYPGHIAKAEKELQDYIKKVDVVIEIRDARIPLATAHPKVAEWVGKKPHLVVMSRVDMIPKFAMKEMREFYDNKYAKLCTNNSAKPWQKMIFINGKRGSGVTELKSAIAHSSTAVNTKRARMGMIPRPIRAAVIGYPNVGKSTLINRILGKNIAKAENQPGVTRKLQWIKVGNSKVGDDGPESRLPVNYTNTDLRRQLAQDIENTDISAAGKLKAEQQLKKSIKDTQFELLDSPGIIPIYANAKRSSGMSMDSSILLAICNEIGQASYDKVRIAKELCDRLNTMHKYSPFYVDMALLSKRYKCDFSNMNGHEIFEHISEKMCQDDDNSAANKLLGDYRKGLLGYNVLQSVIHTSSSK